MSILDTVKQAATGVMVKLTPETPPDPLIRQKHGALGKSIPRVDGPRKVQGQARFAAEVPAEHMTYAALLYSSIARGQITKLDTEVAEAAQELGLVEWAPEGGRRTCADERRW